MILLYVGVSVKAHRYGALKANALGGLGVVVADCMGLVQDGAVEQFGPMLSLRRKRVVAL